MVFSLILIYNYDLSNSSETCKNDILCKVSASSNVTREDFPERENGGDLKSEDRADFPERRGLHEDDNGLHEDDNGRHEDDNGRDSNENQGSHNEPNPNTPNPNPHSGCLIATAAFGSELSPEVQFLRDFRDHRILSTVAGSSFMNVFNSLYYSFSPHVADYERANTWFQKGVKTSIYPLLGILLMAEKPYTLLPSEYGAITSGLIASSLIGIIYFSPFALLLQFYRRKRVDLGFKLCAILLSVTIVSVIISIPLNNNVLLMITTSIFVLTFLIISAII